MGMLIKTNINSTITGPGKIHQIKLPDDREKTNNPIQNRTSPK
jgi:hypothetical protein